MELKEIGWNDVDWIGVARDKGQWRILAKAVMNVRVP
jgi:hypothetical protein